MVWISCEFDLHAAVPLKPIPQPKLQDLSPVEASGTQQRTEKRTRRQVAPPATPSKRVMPPRKQSAAKRTKATPASAAAIPQMKEAWEFMSTFLSDIGKQLADVKEEMHPMPDGATRAKSQKPAAAYEELTHRVEDLEHKVQEFATSFKAKFFPQAK